MRKWGYCLSLGMCFHQVAVMEKSSIQSSVFPCNYSIFCRELGWTVTSGWSSDESSIFPSSLSGSGAAWSHQCCVTLWSAQGGRFSHQPCLTRTSQKCHLCVDLILTEKQGKKLCNWCGQYKSEHQWLCSSMQVAVLCNPSVFREVYFICE